MAKPNDLWFTGGKLHRADSSGNFQPVGTPPKYEMVSINNKLYLTDDNGNLASAAGISDIEHATHMLQSLTNCTNCVDCVGCINCEGCTNCTNCSRCEDCTGLVDYDKAQGLTA